MQFHFEKTLEKRFEPQNQVADGTPAWRVLWLAKALRDWFGQPHRTFYQSGSCQVQFGYEALSFPVSDFASFFGAMVGGIGRVWPVPVPISKMDAASSSSAHAPNNTPSVPTFIGVCS